MNKKEQYAKIAEYCWEINVKNFGSKAVLNCKNFQFETIFICPSGQKHGFFSGCRSIILLGGCFLKGTYEGQLITAVGLDSNDCIYLILYAIVESKTID